MANSNRALELRKIEIEQAFSRQERQHQHGLEGRKEYARQHLALAQQYEQHLKEYGQMALRSIFLLNGGATLALLTFIGSVIQKTNYSVSPSAFVPSFRWFVGGLIATVVSMTFAYLNYSLHKSWTADPFALANNIIKQEEEWPHNIKRWKNITTTWTFRLAFIFGVLGLAAFLYGCLDVADVFGHMTP